ncbi:hypothetical protein BDV95DRAFT_603006 [Massariosphaeria phaeospora]|uniref:Uncharacterized protein n=1 Tax=Massariosphaeria phaeospora TaxID=100035 RepID=A0A7C8IJ49_9PLEO|nr:hypothetical protein BDV95DRAFT_603006 [Massariosphaeria phaeospora]
MPLLDFPPEVFQSIVHELVTTVGVCQAWKLRGVCRTFANEIYQDVFANQPTSAFQTKIWISIVPSGHRILSSNIRLYVSNRGKNLLDANDFLPNKLKSLSRFLRQEVGVGTKGQPQEIEDIIWKLFKMSTQELTVWDKLAGAVAIAEVGLVQSLLSEIQDAQGRTLHGDIFDCHLKLAVKFRHEGVVNAMLQHLTNHHPEYSSGLKMLVNEAGSLFELAPAISEAISLKHSSIIESLVLYFEQHGFKSSCDTYHLWLRAALETGDVSIVKEVLKIKTKARSKVIKSNFVLDCQMGDRNIVAALSGTGRMNPNPGHWYKRNFSPLLAAVESRNPKIVKVVLDAGAEIDYGSESETPLAWAIVRKAENIVKVLNKHHSRANLGTTSLWEKGNRKIWEMLRHEKIAREGVDFGEWKGTSSAQKKPRRLS